jgi:hypothetical protein
MGSDSQKKLEDVIAWLEDHLRHGRFNLVDQYLITVPVSELESSSIIGVLSITFWGKDKLSNRNIFLEQAESILKNRLGVERAENLLKNRR